MTQRCILVLLFILGCTKSTPPTVDEKPSQPADEPKGGSKKGPGPPGANLDYFKMIPGCSCVANGKTMNLRLFTVKENGGEVDLAWTIEHDNQGLQLEGGASPPHKVKGHDLAIGIACNKDIFAIVTGDRVTGWSTKTTLRAWDATLSTPYAGNATPAKEGVGVACTAIPVSGESMQIPLAGGKTQAVNLVSGT